MRRTVGLDDRSGNTTTIGNLHAFTLRPRTNLRVFQALVGVASIAAAAGRTNLTASLNVGLNGRGEFFEVLAVQVNLIRRTIECETHGLVGGRTVEIVNNLDNLRRLLHV